MFADNCILAKVHMYLKLDVICLCHVCYQTEFAALLTTRFISLALLSSSLRKFQ